MLVTGPVPSYPCRAHFLGVKCTTCHVSWVSEVFCSSVSVPRCRGPWDANLRYTAFWALSVAPALRPQSSPRECICDRPWALECFWFCNSNCVVMAEFHSISRLYFIVKNQLCLCLEKSRILDSELWFWFSIKCYYLLGSFLELQTKQILILATIEEFKNISWLMTGDSEQKNHW